MNTDERAAAGPSPGSRDLAILAVLAAASLIERFVVVPWDLGGLWFQLWWAVVAGIYFAGGLPKTSRGVPPAAAGTLRILLLALSAQLLFGSTRYAPQALFPFGMIAAAVAGSAALWSTRRRLRAALVALILLPLLFYAGYGLRHGRDVERLRRLSGDEVARIVLVHRRPPGGVIEVTDAAALAGIERALRSTHPYSPNHESNRDPWQATIHLKDGRTMRFTVGPGNGSHPSTAWIQFGVEVYQNPELSPLLRGLGWPSDPAHGAGGE